MTCPRGKESKCKSEIVDIFNEYSLEFYGELKVDAVGSDVLSPKSPEGEDEPSGNEQAEESIEDAIARELNELKSTSAKSKKTSSQNKEKQLFEAMEIGCECVIFVRTRSPINPVDFVSKVCKDVNDGSQIKRSRYAQRLTPVSCTATANMDGLNRLFSKVLEPKFYHTGAPQKFAIRPTLRNHSTLSRDDIISKTAKFIISAPLTRHDAEKESKNKPENNEEEEKNSVDLKNYDKMIIVECFKSSIGMSVVGPEFEKDYYRFNLEQIFTNKKSPSFLQPDSRV